MTDTKLIELIDSTVNEAVTRAFNDLGIRNKIKTRDDINVFKKTEQLLWNYYEFKLVIKAKYEQIEEIRRNGVPGKSKSILEYSPGGSTSEGLETTEEIVESAVNAVLEDIAYLENAVYKIDMALKTVTSEADFNIIRRFYFEKETLEAIGKDYGVSAQAIFKRKNKMIRKLALYLFPRDTVVDFLEI